MLALARKYRIGMLKEHDPRASSQDNTEILTLAPTPISRWREAADTAMGTLSALVTLQQTLFTATADKS